MTRTVNTVSDGTYEYKLLLDNQITLRVFKNEALVIDIRQSI